MTLITDIAEAIIHGLVDSELNALIAEFIGSDDTLTINNWRASRYSDLRRWAYPDASQFNDAQVKINSGDAALVTAGLDQLAAYVQKCLAVKVRFPKA